MSNLAEIERYRAEKNWGRFFDALDVNRSGKLSHQEFWKWEKIESTNELIKALNNFDVSLSFLESWR